MLWLILLFVVPFYGVLAVAFGRLDPIFGNAVPVWNPLNWDFTSFNDAVTVRSGAFNLSSSGSSPPSWAACSSGRSCTSPPPWRSAS